MIGKTGIIVADSAQAKIYHAENLRASLQLYKTLTHEAARLTDKELVSDKAGRSLDSKGHGRHALEMKTDPKENEAVLFAKEIAQTVEKALAQNIFIQLIIIAGPEFLGHLRESLSEPTRHEVVLEINKNLTHYDVKALRDYITERLT